MRRSFPTYVLTPAIGLLALLLSEPSSALETQRDCAVSLNNDHFVVLSGSQSSVLDVLANDSGDLDDSSLLTVGQTTTAGGTVSMANGTITYNPPPHFSGEDSFSYQVSEADWRSNDTSVPLQISDAGASSSPTSTGLSVIAAPPLGSQADWVNTGSARNSIFGRQLKLEADFIGCYRDSDPKLSVHVQWNLTKRSGSTNPSNTFEASISPLANHPTTTLAGQSYAWPASRSRLLELDIQNLAGSQLDNVRIGLFARARDAYGSYTWRSEGVQASASIHTDHCLLCAREAHVTITVDTDNDGDGVSDSHDVDDDNDGIPDLVEGTSDTDGDGIPNHLDLDSDNDGLLDLIEVGGSSNGNDGRLVGGHDLDGDGWNDMAQSSLQPERDSDGDGIVDFLDLDSDNDGVPDVVEQGQPDRAPRDGRIDGFRDVNNDGLHDPNLIITHAVDTDSDGKPNTIDLDTDADSAFDSIENELDSLDQNKNGVLDALEDSNNNGIIDAVDASLTEGQDLNQNGIDDNFDSRVQLGGDQDSDGISDNHDPDRNGDGWLDAAMQYSIADADGEGTADYLQDSYAGPPAPPEPPLSSDDGDNRRAIAGVDGYGGCSLHPQASFDPILLLISLMSLLYLSRRRLLRFMTGPQA